MQPFTKIRCKKPKNDKQKLVSSVDNCLEAKDMSDSKHSYQLYFLNKNREYFFAEHINKITNGLPTFQRPRLCEAEHY